MPDPIGIPSEEAFGVPTACIIDDESLIASAKESYVCVDFLTDGGATKVHYTDWTSEVDFLEGKYESVPTMDVTLATYTGSLREKPTDIRLPITLPFIALLATGDMHARIFVKIYEVYQLDNAQKFYRVVYRGRVATAIKNDKGNTDVMLLKCTNVKNRLQVPLGIQAGIHCQWIFGKLGCNQVPFSTSGTVLDIQGYSIITNADTSGTFAAAYHRGTVTIQGLSLTIRTWVGGPNFELVKLPPQSWLGKTANILSGCSRTISVCRSYDNEDRFVGIGHAMPSHNPLLESPA